jgi:hypothetical protein
MEPDRCGVGNSRLLQLMGFPEIEKRNTKLYSYTVLGKQVRVIQTGFDYGVIIPQ